MPPQTGMPEIGVLADDLTGAMASAARLRQQGMRAVTVWNPKVLPEHAQAIVANMRTRDANGRASRTPERTAREWAHALRNHGCHRFELRVDSLLRGSPAEELRGLLKEVGSDETIVIAVPAYPGANRFTVGGDQVGWVGTEQVTTDVAARLFPDDQAWTIFEEWLDPRDDPDGSVVVEAIENGLARGVRRFVADATAEEHFGVLARAVATVERAHPDLVTASSGGWLRCHPWGERTAKDFVIVALASLTPLNQLQLGALDVEDDARLDPTMATRLALDKPALLEHLAAHPTFVIVAEGADEEGGPGLAAAESVADAVETVLAATLKTEYNCRGIVAGGGFTASRVAERLESGEVWPEGEVEDLCPAGRLFGGGWLGLRLVAKAGTVGNDGTLRRIVEYLWQGT